MVEKYNMVMKKYTPLLIFFSCMLTHKSYIVSLTVLSHYFGITNTIIKLC